MKLIAATLAALTLSLGAVGAAPAATDRASFAFEWHGSTGWIPLEIASDHHAYFKLRVNGHEAVAMLDPNQPSTAVDARFGSSIGLQPDQPAQLDFPRLTVSGLHPVVKDLAPLAAGLGHPVEVILGADAITGVVADIDLLGHRMSLNDEPGYGFPDLARYIHLERRGGVWLAPVSIEGHRPALFALDIFTGDDLQIAPDYARALGLAPSAQATLVSDDGVTPVGRTNLSQIKFAGAVMTGLTADLPTQLPRAYAGAAQGALGVGVLRRYRLMLDLEHARLYAMLIDPSAAGLELNIFTLLRPGVAQNFGAKPAGAF